MNRKKPDEINKNMPNYEYKCDKCEHYFEKILSIPNMKQPEEEPCPNCGEVQVKKVIFSAPALGDPVRLGIRRPDGGFKEVMQKIESNNRGNTLSNSSFDF